MFLVMHSANVKIGDLAATYLPIESTCPNRNGRVYTYTHSWPHVSRSSWGPISVLASCETLQQASQAWEKGYAAAVIVPEHKSDKAYTVGDMKVIPCPQQTREVTCERCGLCMSDAMLHKQKAVIAFAAHGYGKKRVSLTVLQS